MFQRAQSDRYPAINDMIQTDSPMVAYSLMDQVSSCFRELRVIGIQLLLI